MPLSKEKTPTGLCPIPGSFRDPKGFVTRDSEGNIVRVVNPPGTTAFSDVEASGLYGHLIESGKLIAHERIPATENPYAPLDDQNACFLLRHPKIPFVSYPYEWCFEQLKSAALLQLNIYQESLKYNKTLTDATAYNVQFNGAEPVFIDTLSFDSYEDGMFWAGQRQFTEEFLNPLLLTAYCSIPFNDWYKGSMRGIDTASLARIMPLRGKISFRYFNYIHLPSRAEQRQNRTHVVAKKIKGRLPREGFVFILKQLERWIRTLDISGDASIWADYTENRSYSEESIHQKKSYIARIIEKKSPQLLVDIGCNSGEFSFLALDAGATYVVGLESDHQALSLAYREGKRRNARFLPLYQNVLNPSCASGWEEREREGLTSRLHADFVLALAVLHHIVISGNVPLRRAVAYITGLASEGIIEWVPKSDPMVQTLLSNRSDIFDDYSEEGFVDALQVSGCRIVEKHMLASGRVLFLYEKSAP